MLKFIAVSLLAIGFAAVVYLYILGRISQNQPIKPTTTGQLSPCPQTANCWCSEFPEDQEHYTPPFDLSGVSQMNDLSLLEPIVTGMGGEIVNQNRLYLSAIFRSSIFGFVDDFEARLDPQHNVIHLRSASRVGRSDLGANKKRIERFKYELQRMNQEQLN